jgi:hypothetical protein
VKQAEGNNIKQTKKNVVSSFVVKKENWLFCVFL